MCGPDHEVVKEKEGIAAEMELLVKEWKEKMSGSVKLRRTRENLKMSKMKIRQLREELSIAEELEGELKAKRRRIEESLVPPILRFFDKLKRMEVIDDSLLQETFSSGREQMFKMLEWGAKRVKGMKRPALIYFVDLLLRLRQLVAGREVLGRVDEMAKVVLQELSRPDINWSSLGPREVQVVRRVTEELEGVPNFMARLISQLVGGLVKKKGVDVGVQTE